MVASTTSPSQLVEVLEDLSTRFILNLPSSELSSIPRIIFQVEQAYWYYSDHVQPSHPTTLPTCTLKTFSSLLFQVCPLLEKWEPEHEKVFVEFMKYKSRVPVCGAILVAEGWDKCLLVRGWKGSTWGWPKGKINQNEAKHICAAREVLEETGYDPTPLLDPKHFIELTIQDQRITLFIVPNVPLSFPFLTQTRKEIGAIEWFRLKDLPGWKKRAPGSSAIEDKDRATYSRNAQGNKFYLTTPFVGQLKKWIKTHKPLASSANAPPSPPTNGLPSPTLTPAAASPPMARAEIEGPEGGTKENRISELDELFERFLKDNTGSSTDARTSDSEEERILASQVPASGSNLEGGGVGRLNELLAGLRVREETTNTTITTLSADSGPSASSSAGAPIWDHRQFSTPSFLPQHLYHHPPPPAQQRLDDSRHFPPSGLGPPQHPHQHQSASPTLAEASSHGSLLSLHQSQPPFFGIHTAPLAPSQQVGAPLSPPGAKADKERRLLDLLESSLQASDPASYGSPHNAHSRQPGPQPQQQQQQQQQQHSYQHQQSSLRAGHSVPHGNQDPTSQPQPVQRRTSLLDILVTGNGSERGMRDGLHFDQHGSPRAAAGSRTPTTNHGLGPTTSYGQPSALFNPQQLVQPANGFALPPPSPAARRPSDAARQSQTLLAMLTSPPPPLQAQPVPHFPAHASEPELDNGGLHQHTSPTPPSARLSGKQQNLLDLLSSPHQRTQQVPLQQSEHQQQNLAPERAQPGGERERMLLSLLGASSGGPGRPSPTQHQQQPRAPSFGPLSMSHNTHPAYGTPPPPHAQLQQQLQQQLPVSAGSPGCVGQANDLLNLLNGPPALGRGSHIAQIDVPGYATGSPRGIQSSSSLPGSLAVGRGVNGLPVFGM